MMKTIFSLAADPTPPSVALLLMVAAFAGVLALVVRSSRAEVAKSREMPFDE